MEISIFLAKLLGWYLVIMGLFTLIRKDEVAAMIKFIIADQTRVIIIGFFTIIFGLLLVLTHNYWGLAWPLLITIIAWLTLLAGIVRLFMPAFIAKAGKWWLNHFKYLLLAAIVYLILGLFLLAKAYGF